MVFLNAGGNLTGLIFPIAILAIFYFMAIRPQKKREKEINEMRESLKVNDKVITIGGIRGKIVKVKDDVVTIEFGAERTRMELAKWAIGSVTNRDIQADNQKEKDKATDTSSDEEKEDK